MHKYNHYYNFVEGVYQAGHPINSNDIISNYMIRDFSQQIQLILGHQYTYSDYGDYIKGEYYPMIGMNFSFGDFSHVKLYDGECPKLGESTFGQFFSLSFHFSKYIYVGDKLRIKSIIENGLSYATKPYDTRRNMLTSIGGHLQQYFSYGLFMSTYRNGYELSIGPQFVHHSNSGVYRPNRGINNIALSARVKYGAEKDIPRCDFNVQEFTPYFYHNIGVNYGAHAQKEQQYTKYKLRDSWIEAGCPDDPEWRKAWDDHYNIYGDMNVLYEFMYRINPRYAYGIGIDGFYTFNTGRLNRYYEEQDNDNHRKVHHLYVGSAFRSEIYIKNFAINLHVGYYLNDKHISSNSSYTRFYERIGMRYYLSKLNVACGQHRLISPFVGYFIKGNLFCAEEFEFCLGLNVK